jgi:hypothetical protein
MTDQTFNPTALLEGFRTALAPVLRAQQEGLKAVERFARFQYAVAGDYLEFSLSQAKAAANAKTPTEAFAKQSELGTKLNEQLRGRVQEFSTLATEAQATLTTLIDDATAKFNPVKKAA